MCKNDSSQKCVILHTTLRVSQNNGSLPKRSLALIGLLPRFLAFAGVLPWFSGFLSNTYFQWFPGFKGSLTRFPKKHILHTLVMDGVDL